MRNTIPPPPQPVPSPHRRRSPRFALLALLGLAACIAVPALIAQFRGSDGALDGAAPTARAQAPAPDQRSPAAPFPKDASWLNSPEALEWDEELKGQVVVLDFWTYACINCMHMFPVLAEIEQKYKGQPVVVLGVHSNKFTNEGEAEHIRRAIERHHIEHPVIVDKGHAIWNGYGVQAWPTLLFADAAGRIVGGLSGEVDAATIAGIVDELLAEGKAAGILAAAPPAVLQTGDSPTSAGLAYPGKVLADPASNRLFIADSSNHRIIEAAPDGRVSRVFGTGAAGLKDGPAGAATFRNPQGMALDPRSNRLYVADTDNHAVRAIDLASGQVTTAAGTGRISNDRQGGGIGERQGLNSPWALALDGDRLYIAMAGLHQIWVLDLLNRQAKVLAGSGREEITDGMFGEAALAQPSGLALADGRLYFADSEVSGLRYLELDPRRVKTLIGTGLFDYGDRDGPLDQAQLQHPLGVAATESTVFVADSFNHKIKRVDLTAGTIRAIIGTGDSQIEAPGQPLTLFEPGGLSLAGDHLYIADTNHHRIIVHDLASSSSQVLALTGLPKRR